MHVKQLEVDGFRGIRSLNWVMNGRMVCLVGPGDSTKTTILDAIEYCLSPRWSLPLSDTDFFAGQPNQPIVIRVTVGDLPQELLVEDKFGLCIRGWDSAGMIIDEPSGSLEVVLTIQLTISTDLEPLWTVVSDRDSIGRPISWRERARIGVVRLGVEVDRDLTWGRGSSLSRLTGGTGAEGLLTEAYRAARQAVASEHMVDLEAAAEKVSELAGVLGVKPSDSFRPALDSLFISAKLGTLALHDGTVPVRAAGLGTRRLVALAIQQSIVEDGAILLIDEVEHALEPHRIRRLIRHIRQSIDGDNVGQAIMSTHSPVSIAELDVCEVRIVRSSDGITAVSQPDPNLQGVLRAIPDALLGRRLVVCEGPTEIGLCWGLESHWQNRHSGVSCACHGAVFVDGGGSNAALRAYHLAALGYEVAYFGDSDRDIKPSVIDLASAGVKVICWDDKLCTEERFYLDLPSECVQDIFDSAIEDHGITAVTDAAADALKCDASSLTSEMAKWAVVDIQEKKTRLALGETAKKKKWYKRHDKGARLAEVFIKALPDITETDLCDKLQTLEQWCYGE